MRSLNDVACDYVTLFSGLDEWSDEIYGSMFKPYFETQKELSGKLKDTFKPITDEDLEMILTDIPLKLFDVAESLNKFKLKIQVIKLNIKEKESQAAKNSKENSEAKRKEEAYLAVLEDKLLLEAYESIVDRVDREISWSRELIMSAKKIWDGRKSTYSVHPVSEHNSKDDVENLPAYKADSSNKTYIQ